MLTLTRSAGQRIRIGDSIEITVVSVAGGKVRLGVSAPADVRVHRAELVERIAAENQRALVSFAKDAGPSGHEIRFPEGLFGLRDHDAFVLCDLVEDHPIRCLVSCRDPSVQLLVTDAQYAWPGYPVELALAHGPQDEDVAVALITNVPADPSQATVNTMAPLVIGLTSRIGRQLILERTDLSAAAPLSRLLASGE